ncbi:brain protein I3-like [Cebus imitator]|uniref:brain protein I3-like n=1 Tax=Cebus imitator TaxID=2715852 RepID=UPI00189A0653|nr:brain protein I3-like [Cebus imitator]
MDHKLLLQEWLPTYNLGAGQGDGACSPHGYGAILLPTPSRCLPSPYLITGIPTHHPRVYNGHSRTITQYPANAIIIMRGCPVRRVRVLKDCFAFLGILLAIILFPFGFIC